MPAINDIPTSHDFKVLIGRTGISGVIKKHDANITNILRLLQNVQPYRDQSTQAALAPLRALRKECIAWVMANLSRRRASRPHILELLNAVHRRIGNVIEAVFADRVIRQPRENWQILKERSNLEMNSRRVGRSVDPAFLIERATPSHVSAFPFEPAFNQYREAQTGLKFETWMEQVLIPQSEEDPFKVYFNTGGHVPSFLITRLRQPQRVKYCNETERNDYVITLEQGVFRNASGDLFHTGNMGTGTAGPGWAIFVIGMDNTFYGGSHRTGQFHHSSFLSAAPVQAAGEIAVNKGKVIGLTNKTGHYKSRSAELVRTLFLLKRGGVDINSIRVNDPFRAAGIWISGEECLKADGIFTGKTGGAKPIQVPV
ncbi:hypothetical protein [Granulicella sp. dw_53]|uniref:hypothetical protein n=1 Tax=Granulicella sp. dw_53 TaxID=2719792 RepID=UPI001BD2C421|nr:hypothetical protein [Granulicella sp. dw_53]